MNYQINQISTLCQDATIATAAGVSSMTNRVFIRIGEPIFEGNINIGRLPCIEIFETSTDYAFESEIDHNGTRNTNVNLRISVATFINSHSTKFETLQKIKTAVLKIITSDTTLGVTDVKENPAQITPYALVLDVNINLESSYDKNYTEE